MKDITLKINEGFNKSGKITTKTHNNGTYDIVGLDDDQIQLIIDLLDCMQKGNVKMKDGNFKETEISKEQKDILRQLAHDMYIQLA